MLAEQTGERWARGGGGGPRGGGKVTLDHPTPQGQYCDICTAANSNRAHPVSNAIDGTERWWQSPPLSRGLEYNEVNVTLDLGQVGSSPLRPELPLLRAGGRRAERCTGWGLGRGVVGGLGRELGRGMGRVRERVRERGSGRPGVYLEEFLRAEPGAAWRPWEGPQERGGLGSGHSWNTCAGGAPWG